MFRSLPKHPLIIVRLICAGWSYTCGYIVMAYVVMAGWSYTCGYIVMAYVVMAGWSYTCGVLHGSVLMPALTAVALSLHLGLLVF